MKISTLFYLILSLPLCSCVTTKINLSNRQDYSVLKENTTYTIKTKNNVIIRTFRFKNETNENIIGVYQKNELQINKNDIIKINKFSLDKTTAVILPTTILIVVLSSIDLNASGDFSIPWR